MTEVTVLYRRIALSDVQLDFGGALRSAVAAALSQNKIWLNVGPEEVNVTFIERNPLDVGGMPVSITLKTYIRREDVPHGVVADLHSRVREIFAAKGSNSNFDIKMEFVDGQRWLS